MDAVRRQLRRRFELELTLAAAAPWASAELRAIDFDHERLRTVLSILAGRLELAALRGTQGTLFGPSRLTREPELLQELLDVATGAGWPGSDAARATVRDGIALLERLRRGAVGAGVVSADCASCGTARPPVLVTQRRIAGGGLQLPCECLRCGAALPGVYLPHHAFQPADRARLPLELEP